MSEEIRTDLDVINERIARLEGTKNLWGMYTLQQLKEERAKWYAEDGSAIPVEPPVVPEYEQHSPSSVVGVEGWQTVYPRLLREPPHWVEKSRPEQGLEISVSRSNGCFLVRKEIECADDWINRSQEVADEIYANEPTRKVSARLIHFAGHFMRDNRYLLPTMTLGGGLWDLGDYALYPDVPFNDWERAQFDRLFRKHHFTGGYAVGSKMMTFPAGYPRHYIPTVMNRPDMGVTALMEWFNTGWFREKYYRVARSQARAIDLGQMGRVEGYTSPEDWGGNNTQEWRDEFESTNSHKMPGLWTLGPDGLSR